jgi:hypothetical protein
MNNSCKTREVMQEQYKVINPVPSETGSDNIIVQPEPADPNERPPGVTCIRLDCRWRVIAGPRQRREDPIAADRQGPDRAPRACGAPSTP